MDGHLSVLIMDDEEQLRRLAAEMIERLGHKASTCANGDEAAEQYKTALTSGKRFDLVILDLLVANGMGGLDAALEILQADPDAKIIACSGYSTEPVMDAPFAYGFKGCLPKPYTVPELKSVLMV